MTRRWRRSSSKASSGRLHLQVGGGCANSVVGCLLGARQLPITAMPGFSSSARSVSVAAWKSDLLPLLLRVHFSFSVSVCLSACLLGAMDLGLGSPPPPNQACRTRPPLPQSLANSLLLFQWITKAASGSFLRSTVPLHLSGVQYFLPVRLVLVRFGGEVPWCPIMSWPSLTTNGTARGRVLRRRTFHPRPRRSASNSLSRATRSRSGSSVPGHRFCLAGTHTALVRTSTYLTLP